MTDSVVTCAFTAFNCEDTIVEAISSAIFQTYKSKFILVVDDCSTDNTYQLIKKTLSCASIPHKIIRLERNMGVAYARNRLLHECMTEYIAFFDDDDVSLPERLDKQIQCIIDFEANNQFLISPVCYSARQILYSNGKTIISRGIHADLGKASSIHIAQAILSCRALPFSVLPGHSATCTLFSRTKTLILVGGFNDELKRFEDVALAVKLVINGASLLSVPDLLVRQKHTETLDKINFYKYNLNLIQLFRHLYSTKSAYMFALEYVSMKNQLLYQSTCQGVLKAVLLFLKYPLRTISVGFSSLPTLISSLKHARFKSIDK